LLTRSTKTLTLAVGVALGLTVGLVAGYSIPRPDHFGQFLAKDPTGKLPFVYAQCQETNAYGHGTTPPLTIRETCQASTANMIADLLKEGKLGAMLSR
jgi:hypothetical protein